MIARDSAEGVLLGLACGDTLGRLLEFKSCDEIARQYGTLTEMVADGTHGKPWEPSPTIPNSLLTDVRWGKVL